MNGFIILNKHGSRLCQYRYWGYENIGWVFTRIQVFAILVEAHNDQWDEKPYAVQMARITDTGDVVTYGRKILVSSILEEDE